MDRNETPHTSSSHFHETNISLSQQFDTATEQQKVWYNFARVNFE